MKTSRTIQLLHVRDSIKAVPNCAELSFSELMEKLKNRVMPGITPERYTAMVLCFVRGNITWDDSY